tara:strand:- start:2962 stop:3885 length:924 start_codon:yes stop_codon:yes gene_type:complete
MKEISNFLIALKEYRFQIFKSHVNYVLENYLEKWVIDAGNSTSNFDPDSICLIIEDRANSLTRFSILNTLFMTKLRMKIHLYTSKNCFDKMKNLFSDISQFVNIIQLNINNSDLINIDIPIYNSIFKSSSFWESIPSKKILVFQTDSLLIEPLDFSMLQYDYVGAPFVKGRHRSIQFPDFSNNLSDEKAEKWITQIFHNGAPIDVAFGNGGLSIRDKYLMMLICQNEDTSTKDNEDVFFSRFINKYSKNIAPIDVARRFSSECDYNKSIGFHASYLYISNDQQAEFYERHIKYVISLFNSYKSYFLS